MEWQPRDWYRSFKFNRDFDIVVVDPKKNFWIRIRLFENFENKNSQKGTSYIVLQQAWLGTGYENGNTN